MTELGVQNAVMQAKQEENKMGFGSFLLDVGKTIVQGAIESNERVIRLKVEYETLSDEDLKARFETNESERKKAIALVLKDRGYPPMCHHSCRFP